MMLESHLFFSQLPARPWCAAGRGCKRRGFWMLLALASLHAENFRAQGFQAQDFKCSFLSPPEPKAL